MSYIQKHTKNTDCGYGYKIVCCYDDKYNKKYRYIEEKMLSIIS